MTINSSTRIAGPYTGNGSTTAFPFSFKVFATADVTVDSTRITLATCAATVLLLSLHCVVATMELFRIQGLGEGDC